MRYFGGGVGGGGVVTSVFGRAGAVVAAVGDYLASQVTNDSLVAGATVAAALNTLAAAIPSVPVTSVFGRTGAVAAAAGDYNSSQVNNSSAVTGATVTNALNTLNTLIGTLVPTSRTLTGTSPIQIDGLNTAVDLSSNRTISVLGVTNAVSGVVPAHPGVVGRALLSAAGAGSPTWGTDFGANDLTSTGNLLIGPTARATTGLIRVASGQNVIAALNSGAANRILLSFGLTSTDGITLGDSTQGRYNITSSGAHDAYIGATRITSLGTASLNIRPDTQTDFTIQTFGAAMIGFNSNGLGLKNIAFFSGGVNFNSANRALYLTTATAVPIANPTGGSYFYADLTTSALIWITPAGTMPIGNATFALTLTGAVGSALVGTSNCLRWDTNKLGLYNASPVAQQTVTGSRGGNAALADLLTKLATLGAIVDGTTA